MTNNRISLVLTTALGAGIALLATVLPWYSFDVILPIPPVIHVFAVTVTLWGITTLAPILILVGAVTALVFAVAVDWRLAGLITGLIGLAIAVYAIVRCFDIPDLGVKAVPVPVPALTQVEAGPFAALASGTILVIGALVDLLGAPAGARVPRFSTSRWRDRDRDRSGVPPAHAAR
ncbi:MAG TPA: hypothetical protein VG186_10640 [Solirubrobacteraceae bacterium]|jgi:hypothetical protein|nr:hypothetical protein [Solirubrobacteraceae bacterium]